MGDAWDRGDTWDAWTAGDRSARKMAFAMRPNRLLVSAAMLFLVGCPAGAGSPDTGEEYRSTKAAEAVVQEAKIPAPQPPPSPQPRGGSPTGPLRYVTLLGTANGRALVRLDDYQHGENESPPDIVAVDLQGGRAVARLAIPNLKAAQQRNSVPGGKYQGATPALAPAARPEFQQELRAYVDLLLGAGRQEPRLAVSPDGKKVLFNASDWMYLSVDGGKTFSLVRPNASYGPLVSPDGKRGAFRSLDPRSNGRYCTHLLDLEKGKASRRVEGTCDAGEAAAFSPDGKWLYVGTSTNKGQAEKDGCLVRVDTATLAAKTLGCTRIKSYSMGPQVAFDPEMKTAVLFGDQGAHPQFSTPFIAFSIPEGEARPGQPLGAPSPLFPALRAGKAAWQQIGSGPVGLHVASGTLSRLQPREQGASMPASLYRMAWLDDSTPVAIGVERNDPVVVPLTGF